VFLKVFRERFPDVRLVLRELTSAQQVQALRNARMRVGFLRSPMHSKDATSPVLQAFLDVVREVATVV